MPGARPSVGFGNVTSSVGIRGEPVRAFLEANWVEYADASESAALSSTEIASRGAAVTVRCLS